MSTIDPLQPLPSPISMIGREVGAARWPQPLTLSRPPWKGVVLAHNDLRAWAETIAFPRPVAALRRDEVDLHVARCHADGLLDHSVPVLWDFGTRKTVYWSDPLSLVDYPEDVASWRAALAQAVVHRAKALQRMRPPQPSSPHYIFYRYLQDGHRVWRNDSSNNVREWLDLERLGGDAAAIRLFGFNDLSFHVDPQEASMKLRLYNGLFNIGDALDRGDPTVTRESLAREKALGVANFDFAVQLHRLKAGTDEPGAAGLRARIACARHVLASGLHKEVNENGFKTVFGFDSTDLDRLFALADAPAVRTALKAEALKSPQGHLAEAVRAFAWPEEESGVESEGESDDHVEHVRMKAAA